jgi:DNA-binding protein H-NS
MNENLETKLDEIKLKIIDLVEQKRALEDTLRKEALTKISQLMSKHQITLDDIRKYLRTAETEEGEISLLDKNPIKKSSSTVNPQTGEVWKGRGRPPKWVQNLSVTERELLNSPVQEKNTDLI